MAGMFPVAFTIDGSGRHEFIFLEADHSLDRVKELIGETLQSPNCAEFMSKYKPKDSKEIIGEVRVKWGMQGDRDSKIFPRETLVTPENSSPVFAMMALAPGRDVLDIKLEKQKLEKKEGAA